MIPMGANVPAVGLYSIGVRGVTLPALAAWAARHDIPFLHLRGGVRGYAATQRPVYELERWRAAADATSPIRLLTTDVTLNQLTSNGLHQRDATDELMRAADAAQRLGAAMVRILAPDPYGGGTTPAIRLPPDCAVDVLIEPHHPSWWLPQGVDWLACLCNSGPRIGLLADTAQAANGFAALPGSTARVLARRILRLTTVMHLSDDGSGLAAPGHRLLATEAASAIADGRNIEVAFEWTGPERTAPACLDRYRVARAWWQEITLSPMPGSMR